MEIRAQYSGLIQEYTIATTFWDFPKKRLFIENKPYTAPEIFTLTKASDHEKMSGAADA
jgi:hypothetical protein